MFGLPLSNKVSFGYLYNSKLTTKQECLIDLEEDKYKINYHHHQNLRHYQFKSYHAKSMVNKDRNIFVNGNRALFFEPIQATSIGAYGAINHLIMGCICRDIDPQPMFLKLVEECILFINLHYKKGSDYNTPFWKEASQQSSIFLNQLHGKSRNDIYNYNWDFMLDTGLKEKMFSNFL